MSLYSTNACECCVDRCAVCFGALIDVLLEQEATWHYDFTLMTLAASVVFCFVFFVPLIIWAVLRHFGVPIKLAKLACLYGYSLTAFLPAAVRWLLPRWVSRDHWPMLVCHCGGRGCVDEPSRRRFAGYRDADSPCRSLS